MQELTEHWCFKNNNFKFYQSTAKVTYSAMQCLALKIQLLAMRLPVHKRPPDFKLIDIIATNGNCPSLAWCPFEILTVAPGLPDGTVDTLPLKTKSSTESGTTSSWRCVMTADGRLSVVWDSAWIEATNIAKITTNFIF
jgi:hypothetical protein